MEAGKAPRSNLIQKTTNDGGSMLWIMECVQKLRTQKLYLGIIIIDFLSPMFLSCSICTVQPWVGLITE